MKTSQVLFALFMSSLLIVSKATSGLTVNANSDATQTPATTSIVGSTSAVLGTQITSGVTDGGSYTWAFKAGMPLQSSFILENDGSGGTPAKLGAQIILSVGSQVSLQVSAVAVTTPGNSAGTITQGSGATQVFTAAGAAATVATCGAYYLDCAAGTVTFVLYTAVPGATSSLNTYCTVQFNQVSAIAGVLQYTTSAAVTSSQVSTAVASANTATSPATQVCGTSTSGTNTLYYFISTYGSTSATADQTTAYTAVKAKAAAGGLQSNTAYYVMQLATNAAGGTTAPSAGASSNLVTVSKSQTRLLAVAGLFTTVVATLFGFAL